MIKPTFELFYKGSDVYGLILKSPRKFQRLNGLLKRYPDDTRMKEGEEALFWVPEARVEEVRRILGLVTWPSSLKIDLGEQVQDTLTSLELGLNE
jgi:hypothetical protein